MDLVSSWLSQHQLALAPHKCSVLKIKKKEVTDDAEFSIGNHMVDEQSQVKDLGILVSSDMKWSGHINTICHKASVKSYQILKSFKSKNIWTLWKLFLTYIRPQLEYNSPVWSPYAKGDIDRLENIQRNFTKRAFERCNIPFKDYNDRMNKINILSLKNRREFLDQIFIYKLINNFYDLKFSSFFSFKESFYFLRSHPLQISVNQDFTILQWTNSFFVRGPKCWNELPENIVRSRTLINFKKLLKSHLLSRQQAPVSL